jgi:hypothetical protein
LFCKYLRWVNDLEFTSNAKVDRAPTWTFSWNRINKGLPEWIQACILKRKYQIIENSKFTDPFKSSDSSLNSPWSQEFNEHIPKTWKCFSDPDSGKGVGVLKQKCKFSQKTGCLGVFLGGESICAHSRNLKKFSWNWFKRFSSQKPFQDWCSTKLFAVIPGIQWAIAQAKQI